MTALSAQLPSQVQVYLRRYEVRHQWQRVVRRMGLAIFVTIVWGLAWCVVDRMIALPAWMRLGLLVVNIAAAVAIVGRGVVRLLKPVDWKRAARDVERREPYWRERLATVTSRALGPIGFVGSKELLDALSSEVAVEAGQRDPIELLPWGGVLRPWVASAVVASMSVMLAALTPSMDLPRLIRRYATPLTPVAPAATTRLFVTPGEVKIPAGEALRVRATAQRLDEGGLTLHVRMADRSGTEWTEETMSAASDGTFEARVSNLERDVEYFVTGGDARSDVFRATVLRRPAILAFHWIVTYPPYLKLPPRRLDGDEGVIEAPIGSEVTVEIEASEPLSAATIELGGETIATSAADQPSKRQAKFVVRENRPMQVRMTSAAGVEGQFTGGRVRAIADRPPLVALDLIDAKTNVIKLKYQATDDFGLARLDGEIKTSEGQHTVPASLTGDEREQRGVIEFDASIIDAAAGDELTIRLRGEDRGGQFALSVPLRVTIGSGEATIAKPKTPPETPTTEPSQVIDPGGFGEAIGAYFEAIAPARK